MFTWTRHETRWGTLPTRRTRVRDGQVEVFTA